MNKTMNMYSFVVTGLLITMTVIAIVLYRENNALFTKLEQTYMGTLIRGYSTYDDKGFHWVEPAGRTPL